MQKVNYLYEPAPAAAARAPMEPGRSEPAARRARDLYPRAPLQADDAALDVPFAPICGEFVQYLGRTADGGVLAMSNYRLHHKEKRNSEKGGGVSIPLRLIDCTEVRDIIYLHIMCKDGKTLRCTFTTGEQCTEWARRIGAETQSPTSVDALFAAAYAAWARELPPATTPRLLLSSAHGAVPHDYFKKEVDRLEFTARGAWRVTAANSEYKLCPSYPPLLIVPASIGDEDLDSVARFRAARRLPAVVWRHRGNGAVIARSSQPEVGWLGWRSSEDERLLAAFVSASAAGRSVQGGSSKSKLLIVDARSYTSAVTNRARGGGCECPQYYPQADIQFMCLPNIHHVRRSFHQLRQLAAEPQDQPNWHSMLERSLWLQYVGGVLRAGVLVARAVQRAARPVLVHCSDGWDRTPQIVATAQLLLDPYYRTVEGFRVLVEREWLDFGHKFADRCGHTLGSEESNERSPIFLQWLDLVHQIMVQYPCSFEFSQSYLMRLATHAHSCMFGTFLFNSAQERCEARVLDNTASVWRLLDAPTYRNHLYVAPQGEQVLWPDHNVRSLVFWSALYVGNRSTVECSDDGSTTTAGGATHGAAGACDDDDDEDDEEDLRDAGDALQRKQGANVTTNGNMMTKTRSYDNLCDAAEHRSNLVSQRRSSDPNLTPDVTKLANLTMPADCHPPSKTVRTPFTPDRQLVDSYFDLEPTKLSLETSSEECCRGRADITSNSSSLERELAGAESAGLGVSGCSEGEDVMGKGCGVLGVDEAVFGDLLADVENASAHRRQRHISITWRSVSECSAEEGAGEPLTRQLTDSVHNGSLNDNAANLLEAELGNLNLSEDVVDHGTSLPNGAHHGPSRPIASDMTLCPNSPLRAPSGILLNGDSAIAVGRQRPCCSTCCYCCRRASAPAVSDITTAESVSESEQCCCGPGIVGKFSDSRISGLSCVCGGPAGIVTQDPIDGLPCPSSPVQNRLHQIILEQKMLVAQLSRELSAARAALQRAAPFASASAPLTNAACSPTLALVANDTNDASSLPVVEVGEECPTVPHGAGGVLWVPDHAASRCHSCHTQFWLARRKHHCSRCGADNELLSKEGVRQTGDWSSSTSANTSGSDGAVDCSA